MRRFAFVLTLLVVSIGTAQALVPRATFSKPDQVQIRETDRWDLLVVKFAEGSEVRLREGRLISHRGADLTGVDRILRELPATRGEAKAVFENSSHDFPQRILYRLDEEGELHARIEGREKGVEKSMDWVYHRIP